MKLRAKPFLPVLVAVLCSGTHASAGGAWRWLSEFTPGSSPELVALHKEIHTPHLAELGVAVHDVHWREESFDLHLISGTLFLEEPVQGVPVGAFFTGEATVSFQPGCRAGREDLGFWIGKEAVESETVSHVMFFTLRGETLLEQIGLSEEASVPLAAVEEYEESKRVLEQLGLTFVHAFLNRDGRARNASWVLLPLDSIRINRSQNAYALYSYVPDRERDIELSVAGHDEMVSTMPHKFFFRRVAGCALEGQGFGPHGKVQTYSTRLTVSGLRLESEEETTITFTPNPKTSALRLSFTPRMEVDSVTDGDGTALPFLQWKYLEGGPNYDQNLIVAAGITEYHRLHRIRVSSSGSLFEPFGTIYWLAEEDTWYPVMDDPEGSIYELFFTIPRNKEAVGAGELLKEEQDGKTRKYHFRTSRPHKRSTIYFGDFVTRTAPADETLVEAYVAKGDVNGRQNLKFAVTELSNMVKVFNRLFLPLDTEILRVAATPTGHGRGFEGLILLSARGGFGSTSSGSDVFRAHEVAHQWWGNVVLPQNWPEDRWISESFAEYAAMEYYGIRFQKPDKTLEQINTQWIRPVVETPNLVRTGLTGDTSRSRVGEWRAIIDGGRNVYTKGPMVLQMLRYLFFLEKQEDTPFWDLLRTFLQDNRYKEVSTQDFISLAENHLGHKIPWFWDQWIYGTEIPRVRWSYSVEQAEEGWLLTVDAEQQGSNYTLMIPVDLHFKGEGRIRRAITLEGSSGRLQLMLPEKPRSVALNEGHQALIVVKN